MYPAFVIAVFIALATLVSSVAGQYERRTASLLNDRLRYEQQQLADALEMYRTEYRQYPPTLDAMYQAAGFEQYRSFENPWQRYSLSGVLSDGVWQFRRAVTWTVARRDGGAGYEAQNMCGVGSMAVAASWCGARDGLWFRTESREFYNQEIAEERVRQRRTLQLLADHWTTRQSFPSIAVDGRRLNPGTLRSLPELVGYGGSATTCSGTFVWSGLPFDCGALFDVWGSPVGYQFQSDSFVILASEAPFANLTSGHANVIVATPLRVN